MNQSTNKAYGSASSATDDLDIAAVFRALRSQKWLIGFITLITVLIGGYYAMVVAEERFASTVRVSITQQNAQVVDIQSVVSGVSTERAAINTEVLVIRSGNLMRTLVQKLDLTNDPEFNSALNVDTPNAIERALETLRVQITGRHAPSSERTEEQTLIATAQAVRRAISVSTVPQTYVFDITATTSSPRKSVQIANAAAQLYIEAQLEGKFDATQYAVEWLSDKVSDLEIELSDKNNEVKDLQTRVGFVDAASLDALNLRLQDLNRRRAAAEQAVVQAETEQERLRSLMDSQDIMAVAAELNDPILTRITQNQISQAQMREQFQARLQVLLSEQQDEIESLGLQRDVLQRATDDFAQEVDAKNADFVTLRQMIRERDATQFLLDTFLARLKETTLQVGLQQADAQILSMAIPGPAVAPNRKLIILAALVGGLLAGTAIALIRHYVSDRGYRSMQEMEDDLGVPVLGQIPEMKIRKRQGLLKYLQDNPISPPLEALRNLRTSLFMQSGPKAQMIMVTSSVPGDGKTTLSICLSHSISSLNQRVLLIEADVRRKIFVEHFEAKDGPGFISLIQDPDLPIEDVVQKDAERGFDLLMAGPGDTNAADLFSSQNFSRVMQKIREEYDTVIIDTPPVLVVPDARIIAPFMDSVLFAVGWNGTSRDQVSYGLRELKQIGIDVAGAVLTKVVIKKMQSYGYEGVYGSYTTNYYTK